MSLPRIWERIIGRIEDWTEANLTERQAKILMVLFYGTLALLTLTLASALLQLPGMLGLYIVYQWVGENDLIWYLVRTFVGAVTLLWVAPVVAGPIVLITWIVFYIFGTKDQEGYYVIRCSCCHQDSEQYLSETEKLQAGAEESPTEEV